MVLSGCYGFLKYAFICINSIIMLLGLGLVFVVVTLWLLTDPTYFIPLDEEQYFNLGYVVLLSAGILLLIVAFLGFCGALRESRCMLVTFFSCLLVVTVAHIAFTSWLYTNNDALEELVKSSLTDIVKNVYGEKENMTQVIDVFQSTMKCCGATGPADWAGSKYSSKDPSAPLSLTVTGNSNSVFKVPESCCKDNYTCKWAQSIKVAGVVNSEIYSEGCADNLVHILQSISNITVGVNSSIVVLELLGSVFSLLLCCAIGSSDRYKA